ncbi:hypothetical protein SLEP1_g57398 [Rubroshorea leprosula]|uniref:Uncharacterized protein n=1 Tax=Rubroshorea leprosula TaxID=152421 RepID=A0AAV5MMD1_9ROSI|nr:hypothetical protein SLEP1_g57398 [Rubroshorea leprosula]
MVSDCGVISSEPCAFVGPVSRVHGVCRVPGFGFWGVTDLMGVAETFVIDPVSLYSIAGGEFVLFVT